MKRFNKMLAMALAFLVCLSVSTVALAEDEKPKVPTSQTISQDVDPNTQGKYTISVKSGDTHTYTVYQILTGTLIPGESKLGNPAWGADAKGGDGNKVEDFIASITEPDLTNAQINDLVKAQLKENAQGQGTVSANHSLEVVPGYYLLVDTTAELDEGDSYSLNIIAVFNNIEINPKKGTTESDKKVDDNDADKAADGSEWIDSADYSIGDTVPYKLSATVAEDYANYTKGYKLTFHDDMSEGLTFNSNSVVVKVDGAAITTGYELVTTDLSDGCEFEVRFANLKDIAAVKAGSVITVEFNATLNEGAVIGSEGNPNTSYVTFTNNPNDDQVGEGGTTPEDTVIVFTYETVFNKVDSEGEPLTGADFTLEKKVDGQWVSVTALHTGDKATNPTKTVDTTGSKFVFAGLDAGDYRLTETTTPSGYNTIAPIEFTITAEHQVLSDNPKLTSLAGTDGHEFVMTMEKQEIEGADEQPTGVLLADIENNQGSELPSTGGMGTTLLYTIGGVLVAVSAVGLIARRKMSAEQ